MKILGDGAFGSTFVIVDRHFGMPICSDGMYVVSLAEDDLQRNRVVPFFRLTCNRTGARP
jgi:hypothetical protein